MRKDRRTINLSGNTVENPAPYKLYVNLSPDAREIIEGIREDTGQTAVVAMSRLLEWFAGQDRKFRLAILHNDEETKREQARLVLREMADLEAADPVAAAGSVAGVTFDQAVRIMRVMTDHIERLGAGLREAGAGKGVQKKERR